MLSTIVLEKRCGMKIEGSSVMPIVMEVQEDVLDACVVSKSVGRVLVKLGSIRLSPSGGAWAWFVGFVVTGCVISCVA